MKNFEKKSTIKVLIFLLLFIFNLFLFGNKTNAEYIEIKLDESLYGEIYNDLELNSNNIDNYKIYLNSWKLEFSGIEEFGSSKIYKNTFNLLKENLNEDGTIKNLSEFGNDKIYKNTFQVGLKIDGIIFEGMGNDMIYKNSFSFTIDGCKIKGNPSQCSISLDPYGLNEIRSLDTIDFWGGTHNFLFNEEFDVNGITHGPGFE